MSDTNLFLSTLNLNQLTDTLRNVVREVLIEKSELDKSDKYVSPDEACYVGRTQPITTQTLRNYVHAGLINKYEIKGMTMYKYTEIMDLAKNVKVRSRNKVPQ